MCMGQIMRGSEVSFIFPHHGIRRRKPKKQKMCANVGRGREQLGREWDGNKTPYVGMVPVGNRKQRRDGREIAAGNELSRVPVPTFASLARLMIYLIVNALM